MTSSATKYKLIKKIKDEKFDAEKIGQYSLLVQLGVRDTQVAVLDDGNLVFFEDFVLGEVRDSQEWLEVLQELFDAHEVLNAGYWKRVKISLKNNKYTQVPEALFLESARHEYLAVTCRVNPEEEVVLHCTNSDLESITIFAMPVFVYEWLGTIYRNSHLTFHHQAASLIAGVREIAAKDKQPPLFIYVDRFKLHVLFFQDGRLVYYNQFLIKQFADYVRYIMLVMKSMNMDQQTSKVVLWGYIGKNSPHYVEFARYVRNVVFGERPRHIQFSYFFDELQEHHFFDLYSMNLLD
ncbi:MAG: DUF3822 family protein [Cyclobacteriaceae bacterium]|nr:DUF3822 family protein [Cyclobacteriaceae bacterium]